MGVGGGRVARVNTPPDLDAEQELDLRSVWERIAARWWLPVLGVVLGLVVGYGLALGGGKVYEAQTLVAMGQPFSPNGGAPVQSFLTNARAVSEIVRSESALKRAARASGLHVRALHGNISTAIVGASGPGAKPTGAPLVTITVIAGQPLKAEKAADASTYDEGSLDQYLRDISIYPLIDRDEEVRLAQLIRVKDGEALDKLVRSNLRFVVSVAKKYQNQGVALSDLINEGNLGLIRAAHKFDETKGIKFISYAVWWIRQAILQALAEQSRIVRVPLNRAGTLYRIGKRSNALLQELGREPTHEEIAEEMDLTEEEVAKTISISQTHLSLDAPLTPGEDNRLLDYLPDNLNPTPDEQTFEKALTEAIEESLSSLKEREAKILRLYFGLDGEEPMTLEQIGSLLGITRERVRQIKEKALSRLRHVSRARALESFLG